MQCNVRGFVHCLFTVFVLIEEISVACQHNKSDIPLSTRGVGSWEAKGAMAPPNFLDIEKRTEVEIKKNLMVHSVARANLNKSKKVLTFTTTPSK